MMKEKSTQISTKLFLHIARYFLLQQHDQDTIDTITKGISEKLDAIVRHDLYTKSKTAPTAEEREKARKDYLDKAGISKDFRW